MLLYALTIFVSAFLLFQIQPMIAKMILPWFGGSAAVWITCMLFFQSWLLGGYLYAHLLIRYLKPRFQLILHGLLLAASLFILPVLPSSAWKPSGNEDPIIRILALLTVSVGLPYFLLSTTSPLLQAWYARKFRSSLPYRLFALSNLASLLGLLVYPFFIEPNVTILQQSSGWSWAYAIFIMLAISTAWTSRKFDPGDVCAPENPAASEISECRPPTLKEKILWLLLAACSSTMLLAVTNHLTQNVASIPFLWILPLSLYLFSFILCFDFERLYNRNLYLWVMATALGLMSYGLYAWGPRDNLIMVIPCFCAGLFASCMFCHGELVKRKPHPRFLTFFYIMLSAGGAIGGIIVGLIAPTVFSGYYELPVILICCALLVMEVNFKRSLFIKLVSFVIACGVIYASSSYMHTYQQSARAMVRNFYGMLRVNEYNRGTDDEYRSLVHGMIAHGIQYTDTERRKEAVAYYGRESGVGLAIDHLRRSSLRVGVIGLGAGSMAVYAQPGDLFRFYEINPLVEKLANEEFTYLTDCRGDLEIVRGDARLSLEREPLQHYDLLVVDAFSGDSIPAHLITKQALELYFNHIKTDGILAIHISNAHLDLGPIVGNLNKSLGKYATLITNEEDEDEGVYSSDWVLLTSKPLRSKEIASASSELRLRPELRIWTDDYNNLFSILRKKLF